MGRLWPAGDNALIYFTRLVFLSWDNNRSDGNVGSCIYFNEKICIIGIRTLRLRSHSATTIPNLRRYTALLIV